MKLDATAKGVYAIAVTPFDRQGDIDRASVDRMMDFYIGCGVTGLTILGVMGEAPKLDGQEALALTRQVVARAGALPIVVGVSAPGFAAMRALAHGAMDIGAAGVMIAPPSNLRTDEQIVGYYRQAVAAIGADIPFALQDYPLTFQVVMTPKVIREIVRELPSCVMLKHEDWPGLEKISALRSFEAEGSMRPISILCGNGGLFLDFEMERGADGGPMISSTRICRCCDTSNRRASAWRCANMCCRNAAPSPSTVSERRRPDCPSAPRRRSIFFWSGSRAPTAEPRCPRLPHKRGAVSDDTPQGA
jgi:4-hydroxy-tetrahydrodipicolinate synthase